MKTSTPYRLRSSLRLRESDVKHWVAAARALGLSQSAFLRLAIHEKARRVFREQRHAGEFLMENPEAPAE
jgi:hypothetical protein